MDRFNSTKKLIEQINIYDDLYVTKDELEKHLDVINSIMAKI